MAADRDSEGEIESLNEEIDRLENLVSELESELQEQKDLVESAKIQFDSIAADCADMLRELK